MIDRTSTIKKEAFGLTVNGLVKIAILSVLSYVIMFIEVPIFFFPGFLKIDLSDLPALIGGFALGPAAGVIIELIKNLLHFLTKTTTGGVGEFANFLIGIALIIPACASYNKYKTKKGAITGIVIGIIAMSIVGGLANYYMLIPFYAKIMPLEQIIAWSAAANGAIVDVKTLVLYGIIPFNLLKGTIVAILTSVLYKKLSPILK
ncbi:ECF transporter S component [Crassaminicella thermophila]|uniref:Riboflavin transporter n=1 Tax=Crassaminicella thermophila TaxID=2599308 RepID=A0A5C0SBQ3_CRATE|nr:ECF transporter S component [Crassaminicella thermophila]QEK11347.1 ECF transporter S component [Crassaminicella thermophila]